MPSEKARRKQLFAELDKQAVAVVETRLTQGVYGEHNTYLVREWLRAQGQGSTPPRLATGYLARLQRQPVGILRKKPARLIVWIVIGIVLLEILGIVAGAILSSSTL